ncbi:MAG TPA: hypothetical protein VIH90_04115 [Candidatus Saccharimonadales bacterium]
MQFVESTIKNPHIGTEARVYLPADFSVGASTIQAPMTEVVVEGKEHLFSTQVLQMMLEFNSDLAKRARLGHDWAVFALACEQGISFDNIPFGFGLNTIKSGDLTFTYSEEHGFTQEPKVGMGKIVFIGDRHPADPDFVKFDYPLHFMVRANGLLEEDALYISKLNSGGPVVLHTFTDIQDLYPTQAVATTEKLQIVPHIALREYMATRLQVQG